MLRGRFREGTVYMYVVSFRFVSRQRKSAVKMSSLSLITSKEASPLGMF